MARREGRRKAGCGKRGGGFYLEDDWAKKNSTQKKTEKEQRQKKHKDSACNGQTEDAIIEESTQNLPSQ